MATTIASLAAAKRSLSTMGSGTTKVISLSLLKTFIVRLVRAIGFIFPPHKAIWRRLISVV